MSGAIRDANWVRGMFGRIAPRYDLANHLLSFGIDRYWRARTVRAVSHIMRRPGARVLDLCCGTGDLALALAAAGRGTPARVFGSDFCHPMLTRAREKGAPFVFESDALQLPLPAACVDLVTVAFGFRNLADYDAGLLEMRRVLRPGGMAAILEFSQPPNAAFAALYAFYSRHILPVIGGAVSGSKEAYSYLPASVSRFPSADDLARRMSDAGFSQVRIDLMTGGIAALHTGLASRGA